MLFDLRGAGRQRVVKVVYITLAVLMGGGLVLFGIGGDVSGGLVDAITERNSGGDDGSNRFEQRETKLVASVRANPRDAAAYAELARVRTQLASTGDNYDAATNAYTASGRAELRQAAAGLGAPPRARARQARRPRREPDGPGLRHPRPARRAPPPPRRSSPRSVPSAATFSQLAVFAYAAGQTRKGDLARSGALELTPKDEREALKGQLDEAKARPRARSSGADRRRNPPALTPPADTPGARLAWVAATPL